jgi:CrcB protein
MTLSHIVIVAIGGALGSVCRHLVGVAGLRLFGPGFPWWTLAVNVTGSLAIGLVAGWLAHRAEPTATAVRLVLTTGFLGGFTTFSAFSLDTLTLWERGQPVLAATYVAATLALALAGTVAGLQIARIAS